MEWAPVIFHPGTSARVLMQAGHEPSPPYSCKTLFTRQPAWCLPNVFGYVQHETLGLRKMYHGVTPVICSAILSTATKPMRVAIQNYILTKPKSGTGRLPNSQQERERAEAKLEYQVKRVLATWASMVIDTTLTYPLHVVMVRMVSSLIGGEESYSTVIQSIRTVYRTEGISGFFTGLVPRLIFESLAVFGSAAIAYALSTYVLKSKEVDAPVSALSEMLVRDVSYPLLLCSNLTIQSSRSLNNGVPLFSSWLACWSHLYNRKLGRRGKSYFMRYVDDDYVQSRK